MKIRIVSVKRNKGGYKDPYLAIDYLEWVDEHSKIAGTTDREKLHDWIRETNGIAYVVDPNGKEIFIKAAKSPDGKKYVKTVTDLPETDVLLSLPEYA